MLPINLPSYRANLRLQILILFDILPTRHGNLDQDDFVYKLRVLFQKPVVSFEFLRQALDVIQSIDTDDHLHATIPLLQLLGPSLHLGFRQRVVELLRINTDYKRAGFD